MFANNIINLTYAYVVGYLESYFIYSTNINNNNVVIKQAKDSQSIMITLSETAQLKRLPNEPIQIFEQL
jgi:hypothetical protein